MIYEIYWTYNPSSTIHNLTPVLGLISLQTHLTPKCSIQCTLHELEAVTSDPNSKCGIQKILWIAHTNTSSSNRVQTFLPLPWWIRRCIYRGKVVLICLASSDDLRYSINGLGKGQRRKSNPCFNLSRDLPPRSFQVIPAHPDSSVLKSKKFQLRDFSKTSVH